MTKRGVTLPAFFDYCYRHSLPFAFYRLPQTRAIMVVAQKTSTPKHHISATKKGFVFVPFAEDKLHRNLFITGDIITPASTLPPLNFAPAVAPPRSVQRPSKATASLNQQQFEKYVVTLRNLIQEGEFKKIVAARTAQVKQPAGFSPVPFFKKLCRQYPHALISLVYTPHSGIWIGASPEVLLEVKNREFKTYSLAGTQANRRQGHVVWGAKETEEQQIVSDYILRCFRSVTPATARVSGPETVAAGNLLHLRTVFSYRGIPHSAWPQVAQLLHPTPAVAGVPKRKAIAWIKAHETTPRGFYSGYLGPVNIDKEVRLFVNLRCMKVNEAHLLFYTGCGITKDSEPAKEWNETRMKIQTLQSVLR